MSNGVLSFLTSGAAPVASPTGSDSSTAFPVWLQQSIADTVAAGANLAQQPYPQFPGPLVAQPSNATQAAWGLAGANVGNWSPYINGATSLYNNAAQGVLGAQQAAQAGQGAYQPYLNNATGLTGQATAGTQNAQQGILNQYGSWNPYISNATNLTQAGSQGLNPSSISSVLNPFQQYITQGIDTNLQQNILPSIQDRFVSSGQVASPQEAQIMSNAAYGANQAVGQSLAGAYQGALNSTLASQQQQLAGGQQYGALGQLQAGLASNNLGQQLAAYGQEGQLGAQYGALGNLQSSLTGQGVSQLLAPAQAQQQLGSASGALGSLVQQAGVTDVSQLGAAGTGQDALAQANLNAALNQFNQQTMWPYTNLSYLQGIIEGLPTQQAGSTTQTVGTAYAPTNYFGASPVTSTLSTLGTLKSLGLKKGGRVRAPKGGVLSAYKRAA